MKASTSLQDSKKSNSGTPHGACLTLTDHDRIRQFIQEFTFRGLLPHIEKTIRQLNDQVSLPLKTLCAVIRKNGLDINPVIQKSVLTVLLPSASNDTTVLLKTVDLREITEVFSLLFNLSFIKTRTNSYQQLQCKVASW